MTHIGNGLINYAGILYLLSIVSNVDKKIIPARLDLLENAHSMANPLKQFRAVSSNKRFCTKCTPRATLCFL